MMDTGTKADPSRSEKKEYRTPEIRKYGDVRDLTAGSGDYDLDDNYQESEDRTGDD